MSDKQNLRIERHAHPAEKQTSYNEQQPVAQPTQPAGAGLDLANDLTHGLRRQLPFRIAQLTLLGATSSPTRCVRRSILRRSMSGRRLICVFIRHANALAT
jgi:hypothetical protein